MGNGDIEEFNSIKVIQYLIEQQLRQKKYPETVKSLYLLSKITDIFKYDKSTLGALKYTNLKNIFLHSMIRALNFGHFTKTELELLVSLLKNNIPDPVEMMKISIATEAMTHLELGKNSNFPWIYQIFWGYYDISKGIDKHLKNFNLLQKTYSEIKESDIPPTPPKIFPISGGLKYDFLTIWRKFNTHKNLHNGVMTAIAIRLYQLDNKQLPNSLADLVGKYIEKIPVNCFNNQPFIYKQHNLLSCNFYIDDYNNLKIENSQKQQKGFFIISDSFTKTGPYQIFFIE